MQASAVGCSRALLVVMSDAQNVTAGPPAVVPRSQGPDSEALQDVKSAQELAARQRHTDRSSRPQSKSSQPDGQQVSDALTVLFRLQMQPAGTVILAVPNFSERARKLKWWGDADMAQLHLSHAMQSIGTAVWDPSGADLLQRSVHCGVLCGQKCLVSDVMSFTTRANYWPCNIQCRMCYRDEV